MKHLNDSDSDSSESEYEEREYRANSSDFFMILILTEKIHLVKKIQKKKAKMIRLSQ
jgi:hypothetical protein